MTVLLNSEIFILTLVIGVYLAAVWLFRKTRLSILNPLLVSIPVLALITHFLGISYESFEKGSRIISFMLHEGRSDCGGMPLQRYKTGDPGTCRGHGAGPFEKNDHQIQTVDRVQAGPGHKY